MKSNAGWYIGSMYFSKDEVSPYERESGYYPNERWLISEYENSIGLDEAYDRARKYGFQ